jgi:hypothetical protein
MHHSAVLSAGQIDLRNKVVILHFKCEFTFENWEMLELSRIVSSYDWFVYAPG